MESLLKAEDVKLNNYLLLTNGTFNIPYTQRPYEWNSSQVSRMFNDILAVYEEEKDQHILNFITIYTEDGYNKIYDGQQRTVTLLIILCAIVNKIMELGESELANKIREDFIKKKDWRSTSANDTKIIFAKNETNKFFSEYIVNDNKDFKVEITDNEKYLKSNYDFIKSKLSDYVDQNNLVASDLAQLVERMTSNIYLILLHTPNEEIANQMFETLNNTGKKLADFYVLKNACVKTLSSEKETAKYWDIIEANTDLLNKSNFLTQFVSIYHGKTNEKAAYSKLENNGYLATTEKVTSLLSDMEKVSKYYLELHEPEQKRRTKENKIELEKFKRYVNSLKLFKAVQYRPVILAMNLKEFELKEINEVLKNCLDLQIRNFFVAQHKANSLENFYPDLAKSIYHEEVADGSEIVKRIKNKKVKDEEVKLFLKHRIIKKSENNLARYILKSIYDYENQEEIKVNSDIQYVNLEHILPVNPKPKSEWKKIFKEEIIEGCTYNLGNMTLLLGVKNFSLGNKEFVEKKVELKDSKIFQNQRIAKNNSWTIKEIDLRNKALANKFIEIW